MEDHKLMKNATCKIETESTSRFKEKLPIIGDIVTVSNEAAFDFYPPES
jgi:hypothetical protein